MKVVSFSAKHKRAQTSTLPAYNSQTGQWNPWHSQDCVIMWKPSETQLNIKNLSDLKFGRIANMTTPFSTSPDKWARLTTIHGIMKGFPRIYKTWNIFKQVTKMVRGSKPRFHRLLLWQTNSPWPGPLPYYLSRPCGPMPLQALGSWLPVPSPSCSAP